MTSSPSCRVTALGLMPLALLGALAGCGGVGSDVGSDIGQAVGDGVVCGVRNCTESSTLNLDEISPASPPARRPATAPCRCAATWASQPTC